MEWNRCENHFLANIVSKNWENVKFSARPDFGNVINQIMY